MEGATTPTPRNSAGSPTLSPAWLGAVVVLCLLHGFLYGLIPALVAWIVPSRTADWLGVGYTTFTFLPWAVVAPGVLWIVRHARPSRRGWGPCLLLHLGAFGGSVALQLAASWGYLRLTGQNSALEELLFRWFTGVAPSYTLTVYLGVTALALAWDGFERGRRQELAAADLRRRLAETRLDGLRRRLDPRYLLAGLSTVGELAETDPVAAERLVMDLGVRLRRGLRRPRGEAGFLAAPRAPATAAEPPGSPFTGPNRRLAGLTLLTAVVLLHGLLYGLLPVVSGQLVGEGSDAFRWRYVLFTTVTSLHWIPLWLPLAWLVRRFSPSRVGWPGCLLAHAGGLTVTLALSFVVSWLYHAFTDPQSFRAMVEVFVFGMEVSYHLTFYLVFTATVTAWEMDCDWRRRRLAAVELEGRLAEARLAVLRRRLHPHFLFNALHSVAALVRRDGTVARRATGLLKDLLRRSLEHTDGTDGPESLVPLGEELTFLARYLAMERLRFGSRLTVRVRVTRECRRAHVPALILQPLVENAVHHGLARQERGTVEIGARRDGDHLVLEIGDDGPGPAPGADEGWGWMLTRARLREAFGTDVEAVLEPRLVGGAVARLEFPFRAA